MPRLQGLKEHYETSSVTSSYPVSLDAHVTFEAREAIFTLKNREGKKQTKCINEKKKKRKKIFP